MHLSLCMYYIVDFNSHCFSNFKKYNVFKRIGAINIQIDFIKRNTVERFMSYSDWYYNLQ